MHNTFAVSKPDRNYGYPWWHYFVAAAAQAPYVGFLMATGDLDRMGPAYPYGFKDPVHALKVLTIVGRLVSVAMAAGIVVSSFFFARTLWDDLTGVIAAVLTMLNYLMVYYSRTGNLDVPAFFWSAIGLAILATILTQGLTTRRAAMLGLFIALAIATKDQSVALFVPITFVLMVPRFNYPTPSRHRLKRRAVAAHFQVSGDPTGPTSPVHPNVLVGRAWITP
jgi:4-amino-4-deoxy-L-arabinose transferase-like glycosyltransferase